MEGHESAEARERLLEAADPLFSKKGFASVTLRDISTVLGLSHASLYYHFPGGKTELFAAVMERNILRHGAGLKAGMDSAGPGLRGRLRAAAAWLISQPAMDLIRMAESDMPSLPEALSARIMDLVYRELILRLQSVIDQAVAAREIEGGHSSGLIAGALIGMVESLHTIPSFAVRRSKEEMAYELLDIVLKGMGYSFEKASHQEE